MINLQHISLETFLNEYWQKKPLIIRNALPGFATPISPDELAGLALEEDVESRLVFETPHEKTSWHLKRGPFSESDFNTLPLTHWTLLVQGVDRLIPEVCALLDHFNFIPQWRIDDIMISYAVLHGSVGPHYDNYDVFLYQARGRREWLLTTKGCNQDNYINDLELRIMKQFDVEERLVLEEGDMLYLPPHVGHYGISLSEECMTYSFGYRSYQGQELLESLSDYLAEKDTFKTLYQDPNWSQWHNASEILRPAWQNAQDLLHKLINDEETMRSWFGCFVTQLDQQAELQLPMPLEEDTIIGLTDFVEEIKTGVDLVRDASCRFAYQHPTEQFGFQFYINGCEWDITDVSPDLLGYIANNRYLSHKLLVPYLNTTQNQIFIYNLWKLQWLCIPEH
ncbi:cupin domain-containing protein [Fluoribacter dumoffii]|uniref:Cupin superfamily protein n=1 Tax=Fluoribacter dumoffii TaxID=463 RepID=A0A377GAA4_9GAMM|nr:cupin domain-containing protein [Fluoribacter dumoffii]KTC88770.1 cupin [Fluoribacter dumoffii NY 23]MCW8385935.1 cupin domain-containing protein [Fluoribacter dumoffii]MCW8418988.1 cupin domain-containing protein [Fluoribacter dumoffii]MCW8453168.1 cupin domain-containing protein [Fluoribacter dumoffii]MCW8459614.1 cupin domain-containing protein [Fluoribacter dumoffii]